MRTGACQQLCEQKATTQVARSWRAGGGPAGASRGTHGFSFLSRSSFSRPWFLEAF